MASKQPQHDKEFKLNAVKYLQCRKIFRRTSRSDIKAVCKESWYRCQYTDSLETAVQNQ